MFILLYLYILICTWCSRSCLHLCFLVLGWVIFFVSRLPTYIFSFLFSMYISMSRIVMSKSFLDIASERSSDISSNSYIIFFRIMQRNLFSLKLPALRFKLNECFLCIHQPANPPDADLFAMMTRNVVKQEPIWKNAKFLVTVFKNLCKMQNNALKKFLHASLEFNYTPRKIYRLTNISSCLILDKSTLFVFINGVGYPQLVLETIKKGFSFLTDNISYLHFFEKFLVSDSCSDVDIVASKKIIKVLQVYLNDTLVVLCELS